MPAPASAGAVQATDSSVSETALSVTPVGAPGGSSTLVTVTVTSMRSSAPGVASGSPSASSPSVTSAAKA